MSLKPSSIPFSRATSKTLLVALRSTFFKNGSGTCTAPLLNSSSSLSNMRDANAAPPKPELSVAFPITIRS